MPTQSSPLRRAAYERHYALFHALQAEGNLKTLRNRFKAAPWLAHMHKFRCELKLAESRAAMMADLLVYWDCELAALERKFDPNQPRVPRGNPDGGQWTYVEGYARGRTLQDFRDYLRTGRVRDAQGDAARVAPAQFTPCGPRGGVEAEFPEATPAQQAQAEEALSRVREADPAFKPSDSLTATGSIEGAIAQQEAIAQEAQVRLFELQNSAKRDWTLGDFKSPQRWANQMRERGWTFDQIDEAISNGAQIQVENNLKRDNGATAYIHPKTGRRVVVDNVTKELLHIGGDDFDY